MASSALDDCVSKVDNLILEVGKGMDGSDVPRMKVDPDDPWADIWNPPAAVYKVRAWCGAWAWTLFPRRAVEKRCLLCPPVTRDRERAPRNRIAISSYKWGHTKERSFGGRVRIESGRERERESARLPPSDWSEARV